MVRLVRWLLVIAAPILAWQLALRAGLRLLGFVEGLCPPEETISGLCTASWFPFAEKAVFCFSTALAASLVVLGAPYALLGLLLLGFRRRPTWTLVTAADATNPLRSWPRVLAPS